MESAHYPDAIPIWLGEEAHICYSVDLRVAYFLSTSCDTYITLLRIGAEWRNGGMAE